ncbi:MAG: NRDE family protein [Myxococcota bacterium]
MCTLIAFHRCLAGAPLVVAANRDEFHERPTEGPALRTLTPTDHTADAASVVAPRDLRAGGTWLGVNAHGLFTAITNRRVTEPDPNRRSRGLLVMDALAQPTAAEAAKRFADLPEATYNPFNLFLADGESAHWITYADRPEHRPLAPGAHVVGNVHPDEPSQKLDRLRREVDAVAAEGDAGPERLADLCRAHTGDGLDATCVHAGPYGTRSSTLFRNGPSPWLHYADGPPCEATYRDLTPLLHDLGIQATEGVQA